MKYINIKIKKGKHPKKYTYYERRYEILQLILEKGHPRAITQTQLADRYGVDQSMIHKDMKAIKSDISEMLIKDAKFTIHTVFNKVIRKGIDSPNLKDNYIAAQAAKAWYNWLMDIGAQSKVPEQVEMTGKISVEEALADFIKDKKKR